MECCGFHCPWKPTTTRWSLIPQPQCWHRWTPLCMSGSRSASLQCNNLHPTAAQEHSWSIYQETGQNSKCRLLSPTDFHDCKCKFETASHIIEKWQYVEENYYLNRNSLTKSWRSLACYKKILFWHECRCFRTKNVCTNLEKKDCTAL